jgi:hypothetical protein
MVIDVVPPEPGGVPSVNDEEVVVKLAVTGVTRSSKFRRLSRRAGFCLCEATRDRVKSREARLEMVRFMGEDSVRVNPRQKANSTPRIKTELNPIVPADFVRANTSLIFRRSKTARCFCDFLPKSWPAGEGPPLK